ncbi:MAG: glycosyltransferase family 4 protein [Bacteroidota bacterium]
MTILYIHQYFKTPKEGGAIRSYYLAKGLVDKGFKVIMITAHNQKEYVHTYVDGIEVHYLPIYYANHLGFLARIKAFLTFAYKAIRLSRRIKGVDLSYVMTTPLTTGIIALWLKKFRKIPFYFEVGDLWPTAPVQMGSIKNPLLKRLLYAFESKLYKEAKKNIALSPAIQSYIEEKAPGKQVGMIPNISDTDFFQRSAKKEVLENKYDVKDQFVVTYLGAAGRANHLEYILEVAEACLKQGLKIKFMIAAEGSEEKRLQHIILERGITNVDFRPFTDKEGVKELMNITDAVFISYANVPVLQTGSPNKFFDGLAAGKIIIVNFEGWIKEVIEGANCGFYTDCLKPASFPEQISQYVFNDILRKTSQKNSRLVAEEFFAKSKLVDQLANEILPTPQTERSLPVRKAVNQ